MKKKGLFINLSIVFIVSIVFLILSSFNLFEKLDYRFYDSLINLKKAPPKTENILLVEIDNASIEAYGEWPWSRDVLADALIRMKELGAAMAVFDIEYISPSKNGIAPSAQQKISNSIYNTESYVNEALNQISDAISQGFYSPKELPSLTQEMMASVIDPSFAELNAYINSNISRDNDEYFARSLQFFGNSWLTINHIDLGHEVLPEEMDYIRSRFLLSNISDPFNQILSDNLINFENTYDGPEQNRGFTPALHKIITRAKGAGFTNSVIDSDGIRRRMELISEHDNKYLGQLVFAPLLSITKYDSIKRTRNELILTNAKLPNSEFIQDLKIPLDPLGCILINYRKGNIYDSFNSEPVIGLIQLDTLENQIISCLNNIIIDSVLNEDGFEMESTVVCKNLLVDYENILATKEFLLSKCTGYNADGTEIDGIEDIEYSNYFNLRKEFYKNLKRYLNKDYCSQVIQRLNEFDQTEDIIQLKEFVLDDFSKLESLLNLYNSTFDELKVKFTNSYCIIGNTASSTSDIGATPITKHFQNVGIHANLLNTILTNSYITYVDWYFGFALAFLILLFLIIFYKKSNAFQNIISFIFIFAYIIFSIILFLFFDIYIPIIGTYLYLLFAYISLFAYRFYLNSKEKKFITMMAASFANKDTVDELKKNPDAFKAGGQKKCITALFSDIQKFSTFSEKIGELYGEDGPNKLISILNEYLGDMSKAILKNNGTIDKYEGDAIVSMFGAPDPNNLYTPNQWAYYSIESAIRMKQTEEEFNKSHYFPNEPEKSTIPNPLYTRIGLNSGDAFVGLMGSQTDYFNKLNYTMIGDSVNLASRLEGVNKFYKTWILCSDTTWDLANSGQNEDKILARKLDKVRVYGKTLPIQLYNIIGLKNEVSSEEFEKIDIFNAAYAKYLERDFVNAGKLFVQANSVKGGDETSLIFAERCKLYLEKGIPENWDGIINLTSK